MVAPPEGDGPKLSPSLVQVLGPLPTDWHRKPDEKRFPVKVDASSDRQTDRQTDKVATIGSFSQKENSLKNRSRYCTQKSKKKNRSASLSEAVKCKFIW